MATYPEVQKKAQSQLDAVLGGNRLPEFSDFEKVPYLSAVVNEVFRWQAVTPFAVYHLSTADDSYNGYFIPKGSVIVPNAWAILRDEKIFGPDTDKFRPERFMKPGATAAPDLSLVDIAFGFGRRACPGRCKSLRLFSVVNLSNLPPAVIARDTIWIMAASILAAYEITNPKDLDGNPITSETELEFTNAMIRSVISTHAILRMPNHLNRITTASLHASKLTSNLESQPPSFSMALPTSKNFSPCLSFVIYSLRLGLECYYSLNSFNIIQQIQFSFLSFYCPMRVKMSQPSSKMSIRLSTV